jgi:hypothetical protein
VSLLSTMLISEYIKTALVGGGRGIRAAGTATSTSHAASSAILSFTSALSLTGLKSTITLPDTLNAIRCAVSPMLRTLSL